jgi:integrase/recombinase XerD
MDTILLILIYIWLLYFTIMDWKAEPIKHRGENRIAVYFEKNAEWIARIKKLENVKWSATLKAWHLPDNDENR